MSVKSHSEPNIELFATEAAIKANNRRHVEWLFRQELPLFLGVVDKENFCMRLYSLIPIWFIYYEGGIRCGALTICPQLESSGDTATDTSSTDYDSVHRPSDEGELENWPGMHHFKVNLGNPIATLTLETLKDNKALRRVKNRLRLATHFANLNLIHFHLGIPHFYWFGNISADGTKLQPAFYYLPVPPDENERRRIMGELAPSLISFALHYKEIKNASRLESIRELLSDLPIDFFPERIREALPEIITNRHETKCAAKDES